MKPPKSAKFLVIPRSIGLLALLLLTTSSVHAQDECQPRPADIVFVIDGSRSVRPWHFKSTKDAVKDMVDQFENIGDDSIQIGLIQYGSIVKQEFALGQFKTKEEVNEAIDGVSYMAGGTMTGAALRYLVTRTFTAREGARVRPEVAKIAVVITDGRAQDGRAVELWQRKVKDSGIELFAIGVGRRINEEDLELIASEPKEKHKFYVKNFDLIQNLNLLLKDTICVVDVDECTEDIHGCEQICRNTIGSYYCDCRTGFELEKNRRTCRSVKPPSPVDLSFSEITHTSMRVTWQLDEPERAASVEYYIVMYRPSEGSGETREVRVTEPQVVLENLTPGTEYTVTVKSHANGAESDPLTGSETTLFLGETRLALSNPTLTSLFASWDPAGGDLLSGYIVKVETIGADGALSEVRQEEVSSEVREMRLDGLTPGQSFRVTATPMHGKLAGGAGSDDGATLSLKAPDVLVTDATFKSAVVEWTDIGGAADSFTVQMFPSDFVNGEELTTIKNVSGEAHSVLFTGLNPDTEYTAVVVGHVGEFSSPEGSAEGMTLTPGTPGVSVVDTGLTTIDVTWKMMGQVPGYYEVAWYPTGESENRKSIAREDLSLDLVDLNPGTEYAIDVVAVYIEGEERIPSSKASTTAITKSPPVPAVDITDTGMTTLSATWSVDGIQPDSYKVKLYQSGAESNTRNFTTTMSSMSFTDLLPGTTYYVQVKGVYQTGSEVIGDIISQPGTDQDETKPVPSPEVMITSSGLTTLGAIWTFDALEPDNFIVTVRGLGGSEVKKFINEGYSTTITELDPATEYTVSVAASYQAGGESLTTGEGSARGVTKSPPTPVVDITNTDVTTLDATWTVKGLQPDSYIVEIYRTGDESNPASFTTTNTSMSFISLIPGTRYYVRVRGVYQTVSEDIGDVISPPGTDNDETKSPKAPAVDIIDTSFTTLDAIWLIDGPQPDSYKIEIFPTGGESDAKIFTTANTSMSFTNLIPGTTYHIRVRGVYQTEAAGDVVTPPGTNNDKTKDVPAPQVLVTGSGLTTLDALWTFDALEPDNFVVTVQGPDGENVKTFTTEHYSATIAGLDPATDYTVLVKVMYRAGGESLMTEQGSDNGVTKSPGTPEVDITGTGLATLDATWTVDGLQPDSYKVEIFKDGEEFLAKIFKTTNISMSFTGLVPGTTYYVRVQGVYQSESDGEADVLSAPGIDNEKTKPVPPPKVSVVDSGLTTIDAEWEFDGFETNRFVISVEGPYATQAFEHEGYSITVTRLFPETAYTISVEAYYETGGEIYTTEQGSADGLTKSPGNSSVQITETGMTTLHATWKVDGIQPDNYIVKIYRAGDDENAKSFNTTDKSMSFTDLIPGTTYFVRVVGVYQPDWEGFETLYTTPDTDSDKTKPAPAPEVEVTGSGMTTLDVIWRFDALEPDNFIVTVRGPDGSVITTFTTEEYSAVITGLDPATDYTVDVSASYIAGGESRTTDKGSDDGATTSPLGPNVEITDTGMTSLTATWTVSGIQPDGYIVEIYRTGDGANPKRINTTETSMIFTNLIPGTKYHVRVRAAFETDGDEVIISPPGIDMDKTKLVPAPDVEISGSGLTTLDVVWSFDALEADNFVVTVRGPNGSDVKTLTVEGYSATITGLEPATAYKVSVSAAYQAGGENLTTDKGTVLGTTKYLTRPRVTADAQSWTTGIAEWTGIGVPATRYRIVVTSDDDRPQVKEIDGSQRNATLTGLAPNKEYIVTVIGIVEEGGRVFTSPQGSDTFEIGSVPEPDVDITSTGLTTARVSWTPSDSDELTEPTGYRVAYFPTNDTENAQTLITEETSVVLTGLNQGTEYTVTVVAHYQDPVVGGISFESSPGEDSDTTKSLKAPDVTATVTSPSTTQVDWTSDIGFAVSAWRIEYRKKDSVRPPLTEDVEGDVTTIILDDLERDAEYEVHVYGIAEEDGNPLESPPGSDDFVMRTHIPPNVNIGDVGLQTMYVIWLVEGKYPSRFEGRYYPTNNPENVKTFETEDLSYKMTGLDQDTEYTVEIVSVYDENGITVKTDPGYDSDRTNTLHAPDVTNTGSTYTTADIEWTGVGAPAEIYYIEYKIADSENEPWEFGHYGKSTTLMYLEPGEEYYVTVKGIVAEGGKLIESPVGSESFILGDLTAPEITITARTNSTMHAAWVTDIDVDSFFIPIRGEDGTSNEYTADGDTREMIFDSLSPGTEYTIFIQATKIEAGVAIESPPGQADGVTKPSPPRDLLVIPGKPTTILVSFQPPWGGYDYFEAKCVPDGTNISEIEHFKIERAESLSALCENVEPGSRYTLFVRTILGDTPSEWASLEVFKDSKKDLGPPQNFDLSEPTIHTIVATWEPPEYVDVVDQYVLSYQSTDKSGERLQVRVPGSQTRYLIQLLRPSTPYQGSIVAVVGSAVSQAAEDIETTLGEDAEISVVDSDYNTIEVKWPVSLEPQVSYLLRWQVAPNFTASAPRGIMEVEPAKTTAVIRDLDPATIYDITIQYMYPIGTPAQAQTSGTTLAPPPGPLTFTDIKEMEYVVHWGKPGYNAQPVGYIVTYVGPEPGEIVAQPEGADTLKWKFDSLKSETTYNVTVIAQYQNGIESEPVYGRVTTRGPPGEIRACSCSDYMVRQTEMQRTVEQLVGAINALTNRIGNLESRLTQTLVVPPIVSVEKPTKSTEVESEGSGEMISKIPPPAASQRVILLQEIEGE